MQRPSVHILPPGPLVVCNSEEEAVDMLRTYQAVRHLLGMTRLPTPKNAKEIARKLARTTCDRLAGHPLDEKRVEDEVQRSILEVLDMVLIAQLIAQKVR